MTYVFYVTYVTYVTYPHVRRSCPGQRIAYSVIKQIVANMLLQLDFDAVTVNPAAVAPRGGASKLGDESSYTGPFFDKNLMLPVTPMDVRIRFNRHT